MLEVRGYKNKNDTGYEVIAICYTEEQAKEVCERHSDYEKITVSEM